MTVLQFRSNQINAFTGDYSFLSNFYPAPVFINGLFAKTVEHGYQAAKTLDIQKRNEILACRTPAEAKKLGKNVPLRVGWDGIRLKVMKDLVRQKFALPSMASRLLRTREAELIEGNWWHDSFWGVDNLTGKGENHLGIILMEVRDELKKESNV